MKFVHALALILSVALVFSGAHGYNLRQDASRDLVGEAPVVCGNTKCNIRSTCINDKCVCKPGWKDPPYCKNLNECKELDPPPCKFDGAVCVDEFPHLDGSPGGMYHCACKTKEGWINGPISNDHGPLSCGDLDECSQDPAPCHPNATCTNLKPGFTCTCKDGFEGDGQVSCVPKVPPVNPPKGQQCDKDCLTIPNTFCDETTRKCTCLEGFFSPSGLGGACQGRNYCQDNLDNCSPHAQCIPLVGDADAGFFACECNTGYITATGFRQGTVCVPHNECLDGTNNCKANEVCVDLSPPKYLQMPPRNRKSNTKSNHITSYSRSNPIFLAMELSALPMRRATLVLAFVNVTLDSPEMEKQRVWIHTRLLRMLSLVQAMPTAPTPSHAAKTVLKLAFVANCDSTVLGKLRTLSTTTETTRTLSRQEIRSSISMEHPIRPPRKAGQSGTLIGPSTATTMARRLV